MLANTAASSSRAIGVAGMTIEKFVDGFEAVRLLRARLGKTYHRVAGTAFEGQLTRRASEERTRLGRALLKAQIAAPLLPRRVSDALSKKCELDSRETRKFHGCDKLSCGLPCT